jgi:hypothetical protein
MMTMMMKMMRTTGTMTDISLAKVIVGGWNLLHATQNYEVLLPTYLLYGAESFLRS